MSTIERTISSGEVIIREGDEGNTFFQLLEGKVGVYNNYGQEDQVQIAILEPGTYFGEMAVIESYPRSSTVVAEEDSRVIEIAASELNEYITENPNKILDIIVVLGNRLKTMTDDYNEIKKALDNVRKENSKNNYASFFASMSKQSIYLSAKNFRLEKPSAEALREAADAVSKKGTSGETYPYGTIIFKQGEPGKCMYIVHSGSVCIYSNYGADNEIRLSEVKPVACFGEMGLITQEARTATAVVESNDTQVEIIYPDGLEDLFKSCPEKIDMILKNLSYRLRVITYEYCKACKEIYDNTEREEEY